MFLAKDFVDEIAALCRLDDGEGDIVVGNARPVDLPLMMGDVDAAQRIYISVWREAHEVEIASRGQGANEQDEEGSQADQTGHGSRVCEDRDGF